MLSSERQLLQRQKLFGKSCERNLLPTRNCGCRTIEIHWCGRFTCSKTVYCRTLTQASRSCVVYQPSPAAINSSHTTLQSKNTQNRVGFLKQNAEHGLSSMKKHVERDHQLKFVRYSKHAKEIEDAACDERYKGKKRNFLPSSSITELFCSARPYIKCDSIQIRFIKDLVLLIAKGSVALSMVKNTWLRCLVMRCGARVVFPTRNQLSKKYIPQLVATTIEHYVYPVINSCDIVTVTFDLQMSRTGYDTFAVVENFVDKSWVPNI